MNVGLLESHKTYEGQQNEDQQVDHLLPPSGESGSEYGLLDIEQIIMTYVGLYVYFREISDLT